MRNFTYRLKSKKAYTLVELVVTIAILSITAGFGIGIFASALRHYSSASVTAKDQEVALSIEKFIVNNARTAKDVEFIDGTISQSSDESYKYNKREDLDKYTAAKVEGAFITHEANAEMKFQTFYLSVADNLANKAGVATNVSTKNSIVNYNGLDRIEFTVKKQYQEVGNDTAPTLMVLNYSIFMDEGYVLRGSTVLYNCRSFKIVSAGGEYIETAPTFVVGKKEASDGAGGTKEYTTGVAFVKDKEV